MLELGGYAGAFLLVDLSRRKVERKPLNWGYARALKQFRSKRFRCHLCPIGCGP